jgi:hypothetical protein
MNESSKKKSKIVNLPLAGHFDYVQDSYAYGWAYNPLEPLSRVTVDILADGNIVAHGEASVFRQDLHDANIGDGRHGFRLKLSYELLDDEVHVLTARNAANGHALGGEPINLGPHRNSLQYPLIRRNQGILILQEQLKTKALPLNQDFEKIVEAYRLGARLQETSQIADARHVWQALAKVLGPNALCICKVAETHLLENEVQSALELYLEAAEIDLMFAWAHIGLSTCHRLKGDCQKSEDALEFAEALIDKDAMLRAEVIHSRSLLFPQKIKKLLKDHQTEAALVTLTAELMANPHNHFALDTAQDILSSDINHAGSLSTHELLKKHYGSMRLLKRITSGSAALDSALEDNQTSTES